MKVLILTIVASLLTLAACAQGTLNFVNVSSGAGINAPVYLSDGTTKLTGPNYVAQLLAGSESTSLALVGSPTPFLSGGGAGYFNGGTVTIPTVAGGANAFFQVVAWDTTLGGTTTGATEPQAFAYSQAGYAGVIGFSSLGSATTGNPAAQPPTTPGNLVGLTSFFISPPIPEPSTFALAVLSAAALVTIRRRQ